jgi:glutamate synthase (NADPH/NADH) large chain
MTDFRKKVMFDEGRFQNLLAEEHDSCGIICIIEKDGTPTHDNIQKTIDALIKMEHRSGFIDGEGDGCGILTDIPKKLWKQKLSEKGLDDRLADDPRFFVGHLFIPHKSDTPVEQIQSTIREMFKDAGISILLEQENAVNSTVLGKNGRADEPLFWQISGLCDKSDVVVADHLFDLHIAIESEFHVHVASLNNYSCAYKVMGAANILPKYFHDVQNPLFASQVTIGHNRYSTNTLSSFFRVQPFSLLGHNGEINTVKKLRQEAAMLDVPLVDGGSDSQDLNRTIETFIHRFGLSLFEAMEIAFPPIVNEIKLYRQELQDLYAYYRQSWGPFSQGPAGIVSRYGEECVFSVDALGLRPLWMVESEASLYFSSEQGVITVSEMVAEPKPIAPGEKIGVQLVKGSDVIVVPHERLQSIVLERAGQRVDLNGYHKHVGFVKSSLTPDPIKWDKVTDSMYSAFGWDREQIELIQQTSSTGAEPIRSLGHDGPLAAINEERQNIADFIKESVAVVTNPAIDRDREMEHFSTRVIIGGRPALYGPSDDIFRVELSTPLLTEGVLGNEAAKEMDLISLEQLVAEFKQQGEHAVTVINTTFKKGSSLKDALDSLGEKAVEAALKGCRLILLDDSEAHRNDQLWIDPHLALAAVDNALRNAKDNQAVASLRRQVSIGIRSGALRSLHDIIVACGLGAEAISPYLLFATVSEKDGIESIKKAAAALSKGLEKVISTIGTHELRGYSRLFSSIGLHPEVADVLEIVNYCGSERGGTGFAELEADAEKRYEDFYNEKAKASRNFHFFTRIWKALGQVSSGESPYEEYAEKLAEQESNVPISIRHLADINFEKTTKPLDPAKVDIGVGDHSLPMLISSMSFGSQNETAFRAYAEAGERLNMVTMNGEGGEIKDMLGRYKRTRGMQIASGRFGVNVEMINSAAFLEIKIGQGAKPGEGGHLPGTKVTSKIAAARNATIGSDLISPSNNHDIYSIEDLAQIISELKEASGGTKVIVKVPVVPGIGTIAVGIAKAGADVITLSGFDGGTGAARIHALQHVGLPTEIGTKAAHLALIESGLRHKVEIWSDGGLKSGKDVIKMILLGANRCGFGSIAMQAIGCTTCRGCHLDTCHVGIATQIDSLEEAKEKGLRRFVPRVYEPAVEGLVRLFNGFGEEIRQITAQLGFSRTQDLVGRSDLLKQVHGLEKMDLTELLRSAPIQFITQDTAAALADENMLVSAAGAEGQSFSVDGLNFEGPIERTWSKVHAAQRIVGSRFAGARVKNRLDSYENLPKIKLSLTDGSVPGNGLAAFNAKGIDITVHGGAEDGVGKMSFGGKVAIMKSQGRHRQLINGSVGKSFGYGSQKGLFLIQGNADSRACIRLSGADVVFGGEIAFPLQDELAGIASRANLKGFAFEYMTNGRAVVLGDPGPWICAGMTGGVIYQRLVPEMGLTKEAILRRIAKGAKVALTPLGDKSRKDLKELLGAYHDELVNSGQTDTAAKIKGLLENPDQHFIRIAPEQLQADQSVATE